VADEHGFAAMGGDAESVSTYLKENYRPDLTLEDAVRLAVRALGHTDGGDRQIEVDELEVAWLDRTRPQQRKFRRLDGDSLSGILTET
jgi:proteasome alpha subunit